VRDQVLHAVLQSADMTDLQSWQPLLRRTSARLGLAAEETGELEEALERFLHIEGYLKLWESEAVWVEQEFLLEWPRKRPPRGQRQRPVVRGVLDVLWRNGKQAGLLWLTTARLDVLRPGIGFWVHAAHQLCGVWPQIVEAYSLADAARLREDGTTWCRASGWASFMRRWEDETRGSHAAGTAEHAGGRASSGAAGRVLDALAPKPGETAVDCTTGWGGHAVELLRRVGPGGRLIAIDLDAEKPVAGAGAPGDAGPSLHPAPHQLCRPAVGPGGSGAARRRHDPCRPGHVKHAGR